MTDGRFGEISSLALDNLTFGYEPGRNVFESLSFEMPMNGNIFITGQLGSGASTLLKLLSVLVQPQSGSVKVNGINTSEMSFDEFLPIRKTIGYTFDLGGLLSNRTLSENLKLPLLYHKLCSEEEAEKRVMDIMSEFSLLADMEKRPGAVGGGVRKLACVLRAFVIDPQMIVMDDPFTGLGMENSRKLVRLVQERREKGTLKHVFLTSRDEVWPHWIGCDALYVEAGQLRFEQRKAA